jgi:hypothetical protein
MIHSQATILHRYRLTVGFLQMYRLTVGFLQMYRLSVGSCRCAG